MAARKVLDLKNLQVADAVLAAETAIAVMHQVRSGDFEESAKRLLRGALSKLETAFPAPKPVETVEPEA